jgi:LuxR family maltose regulon positive regulatory protein
MTMPILATKLYVPSPRPKVVLRPRLVERLNEGLSAGRKLTLISAPAGFGKTTLVSEWLSALTPSPSPKGRGETGMRAAWLSLDDGDNDLTRFLTYLITALQTIAPHMGAGVLAALQSPQPPPTEAMLTALLNEMAAIPDHFVLVLDDYHVIDTEPVDQALTFLLEYLPPRMHLVIATREDPQLSLARYRARGQLIELRTADLRFTPAEAAEFLNQVMGLTLSAEDIAALETRTEGWIAGLQMAALSMQGRSDTAGFIKSFTGSHRFVLDYLVEEVLQRQPGAVRDFLLQTAILDRLSGPLCDAVTGRADGRAMLDALERDNLFVIPLDDRRQWYRYHHLFADVLHAHLAEKQPHQVAGLHRRASEWYEQNSLRSDAIRHALVAQDFGRAADLIELACPIVEESSQTAATWLGWAEALPDELVRARPVLSVGYAYALLGGGQMEAAEARLKDAERWLAPADSAAERPEYPATEMVVVDKAQFRSLPATIAVARAYRAQALGDIPATVRYARQVLDLLPEGEHLRRGQAAALLGITYWANGDLEAADRTFADYNTKLRAAGNIIDTISTAFVLAEIRTALGRLREAIGTLEQTLHFVVNQGGAVPPFTADLYRGLSELCRERGDLEAAARALLRGEELLGEQVQLFDVRHRLYVAQARLKQSQGDLDVALDLLDEAEPLYIRTPLPDMRPIAAMKARIWVAQGRLDKAMSWARERGLSADDDLSIMREFEHITLARVLIARYRSARDDDALDGAMRLLERLLKAAEEGGRLGSMIEILVLQALAHQARDALSPALVSLERALSLAESEGYVQLFVDEGPPLDRLLHEAVARGTAPDNARQMLAAFSPAGAEQARRPASIESLSERELEVLRHIAEGLTNQEIADRLYLSLYTVKAHARSIYDKLDAHSRTQAVARARDLGVLPRA